MSEPRSKNNRDNDAAVRSAAKNPVTYDAKVLTHFQIYGCYFIDIFYNHLFESAREAYNAAAVREENSTSMIDEYKEAVRAYTKGLKMTPKHFNQTIAQLHSYFKLVTNKVDSRLDAFTANLLEQFVPQNDLDQMRREERDGAFHKIINDIVGQFGIKTLDAPITRLILSRADSTKTVRMLKDIINNVQINIRETMHVKALRTEMGVPDQVPIETVEKLTQSLSVAIRAKCEIEALASHYKDMVYAIYAQNNKIENDNKELMAQITQLQNALTDAKKEVLKLRTQNILTIDAPANLNTNAALLNSLTAHTASVNAMPTVNKNANDLFNKSIIDDKSSSESEGSDDSGESDESGESDAHASTHISVPNKVQNHNSMQNADETNDTGESDNESNATGDESGETGDESDVGSENTSDAESEPENIEEALEERSRKLKEIVERNKQKSMMARGDAANNAAQFFAKKM